jgi:hypothetical protein
VHALSVLRTPSNHLHVLPTQKVLSTCPPAGATLASPLARQVPDTEPRDGPQIQIAKRLRREVRPNSSSQSYFTVSASASASGNRFFLRLSSHRSPGTRSRPNALAAPVTDTPALGGLCGVQCVVVLERWASRCGSNGRALRRRPSPAFLARESRGCNHWFGYL